MGMDWLNIAGGAAKGYVQGDEDNRRREEFNSLQRQRNRVEKEQKLDDELAAELKNVRPAGKYQDVVERTGALEGVVEKHPEFVGPGSGALRKEVKVSAADADRQRADILARRGNLQSLQAASTLRQGAHQTEQAERAESRAQAEDVFLKAGQMRALGNHVGAMRHLAEAYDKVPDGHKLTITEVDGVPHVGVAGPSGEYIEKPVPITGEVVDRMINRGIEMTSVQAQQKGQELGIHKQSADSQRITAEAAKQAAETARRKAEWETIGKGGDAALAKSAGETAAALAHADYWKQAKAAAAAGAHAAKFGQSMPFSDGKGGTVYMTPIRDSKSGKITWQRDDMPEGLTPFKKPQELNDAQKVAMTAEINSHQELVKAGGMSPVEANSRLQTILNRYGAGSGDGTIGALQKAAPPPSAQFGISGSNVAPSTANILGGPPPAVPRTDAPRARAAHDYKPRATGANDDTEARRQREKFLKPPEPTAQITPEELYAQAEAQIRAANQR